MDILITKRKYTGTVLGTIVFDFLELKNTSKVDKAFD